MKQHYGLVFFLVVAMAAIACNNKQQTETTKDSVAARPSTLPGDSSLLANPYATVDASPMDMSYFPVDYPHEKMIHGAAEPPYARVIYSRPHLHGRNLFGENGILKYGESWRLGANESTELQLYRAAVIQGKKVPAGRYIIYCIPYPDKWKIVLNGDLDSWGLTQDSTKDIFHFEVPVKNDAPRLEYFTMVFENKSPKNAELFMAWDRTQARLPVEF